jgi:hypothetical protein
MAELPQATITIDDEAGTLASGVDLLTVIAAVATNADTTPRLFSSTKALLGQHGYSQAADYCAMHFEETKKPVLFVGLPIVTAGAIGRIDNSGNTGSSVVSAAAATSGVVEEVDAIVTVASGGTVGTDLITFDLTLDGGRTTKRVRLGTETSYAIPYVGIVLNFTVGTLTAGQAVLKFKTTAPRWDQSGLAAARTALAAQNKQSRSWMVIGDLQANDDADDILTEVNGYQTANDRDIFARAQVRDRLPQAQLSTVVKRMTGSPNLTFLEVGGTGDTITRSAGSWIDDGFAVGDVVTVAGSTSNNVTGPIATLTDTVLTFGTTDLVNEGPIGTCTVVGSAGLTFAEVGGTGDTVTRSAGSWLADGFRVGDSITFVGTASNDVTGTIATLTATVLTFGTTDLADEVIGSHVVTATAGESDAVWAASIDAEFGDIDDEFRIDLGAGRGRKLSPIHGWRFRRPVQWAASIREYQHDLQIPTWRKSDGKCDGWDLEDADGNTVEHDERIDQSLLAARFTCFRTWANGPAGPFIALSLTRALEGSLLSRTHNVAVANLACTVAHSETENAIGEVLELNDDGTGTEASLIAIEERVNSALAINLLQRKLEGPRASAAKWSASRTDVLNIPGAELTGTLDLRLNGTLEKIRTRVRIQTAG